MGKGCERYTRNSFATTNQTACIKCMYNIYTDILIYARGLCCSSIHYYTYCMRKAAVALRTPDCQRILGTPDVCLINYYPRF